MVNVIPKYSKNEVNRAGKILVSRNTNISSGKISWANLVLSNWRVSHAYPINTFQATLRNRLKHIEPNALVAQRLKRTPSILNKLNRFGSMKLAQMQDIGGLRAVLPTVAKVRKLEKLYRSGRLQHELISWKDYIEEPKADGYRGVHLIFKYKNDRASDFSGLLIELQLRTQTQHAWATAVETMGTFSGQALKSGEGEKKWREFFTMASLALSHREKMPTIRGYGNLSEYDIYKKVSKMNRELGVLEKLNGFAVAADHISHEAGNGTYNLIILNSKTKVVTIKPYSKNRLNEANLEYDLEEDRTANNKHIEVVLVSAGPINDLKKAYPNYFLDTQSFIRKIKHVIEISKNKVVRKKIARSLMRTDKNIVRKPSTRNLVRDIHSHGSIYLSSKDVPQADNLDAVRKIIEAINMGYFDVKSISNETGFSPRHVNYRISSAEILGCIDRYMGNNITSKGVKWLKIESGSEEESNYLKYLIEETKVFRFVVPDLFSNDRPNKNLLTKRIADFVVLSETTAVRRASTLIAWSNRVLQYQLLINGNKMGGGI